MAIKLNIHQKYPASVALSTMLLFVSLLFGSSPSTFDRAPMISFADAKVFNILDYGADDQKDDLDTARQNGKVFYDVVTTLANTPPSQRDLSDNDGYNTVTYTPRASGPQLKYERARFSRAGESAPIASSLGLAYVPYMPFTNLFRIKFEINGRLYLPNTNESRATWPSNPLPQPTLAGEEEGLFGGTTDKKGRGSALNRRSGGGGSSLSAISHLRLNNAAADKGDDAKHSITSVGVNAHLPALDAFYIFNSTGIRFDGSGEIDGQGYPWWWEVVLSGIDRRPYLILMKETTDIYIGNMHLRDSPMYTIMLHDTKTILIEYLGIYVSIWGQMEIQNIGKELTRKALAASLSTNAGEVDAAYRKPLDALANIDIPMFPLNTDGIDIAGSDVVVRHCFIENFDDALCPKPLNKKSVYGPCSRNHHWYNHTIVFGVGASMGSVPPNPNVNCIADIVVEDVHFTNALKTLYIKPNPCPRGPEIDGTGIINNITYKDITTTNPVTWPLWFSTQQQKQPGNGTDTGCSFLYPLPGEKCPVYPCVPITNVLVQNVTSTGGILSPGVMRCDPSNPCRNYTFDNVRVEGLGFPWGSDSYLCEGIDNLRFVGDSYPSKCISHYP